MALDFEPPAHRPAHRRFCDSQRTADGSERAHVSYRGTQTLWFNTGTLCNIACANCYIESSPTNDRLVYLTRTDIHPFLDELDAAGECPIEIGFTGGEPFMAPQIIDMIGDSLARGHRALVLTNAMAPMMRPAIRAGLLELYRQHGRQLTLRVSLDHYSARRHDQERTEGSFAATVAGLAWLSANDISITLAGRTMWGEDDAAARGGYAALIGGLGLCVDASDPKQLVLFPEMRADSEPPEITTACWSILGVRPDDQMCASQRMVVRRKGADAATVLSCTLLPYDERFEMGRTLAEARRPIALNHPWCASFCVLGGGSCSA